jgi:DNA-binding NarL/FixJ family response regulator
MTDLDIGTMRLTTQRTMPELHPLSPRVPLQREALPHREPVARHVSSEELRLLSLLAEGLPLETIARRLSLSDRTVRRRSKALCDRMGARAPIQVVAWAARNGLI